MLHGGHIGELELRRKGGRARLRGRFNYNSLATLSDGGRNGGRPRKESIASRAFRYRIEDPREDIHLLVGHDYARPLASRATGTLDIQDGDDAVTFTANIAPEIEDTTWARDALAGIAAGLIIGLSPGFRLPPPRAEEEGGFRAETVEEEPDDGPAPPDMPPHKRKHRRRGALIRRIHEALLFEMSVVTMPAYSDAQVEARNWQPTEGGVLVPDTDNAGLRRYLASSRWR